MELMAHSFRIVFVGFLLALLARTSTAYENCSVESYSEVERNVFADYIRRIDRLAAHPRSRVNGHQDNFGLSYRQDNRGLKCYVCDTGQDDVEGLITSLFGLYTEKDYDVLTARFTNRGRKFRFSEIPPEVRALDLIGDFDLSCLSESNSIEYLSLELGRMNNAEEVCRTILRSKDIRVLHYATSMEFNKQNKNSQYNQILDLACLRSLRKLEDLYLEVYYPMKNMQTVLKLQSLKHAKLCVRYCTIEYALDEIDDKSDSQEPLVKLSCGGTPRILEDAFMTAKSIQLTGLPPSGWMPPNNSIVEELVWQCGNVSGSVIDMGWVRRLNKLKYLGLNIEYNDCCAIDIQEILSGMNVAAYEINLKNCVPNDIGSVNSNKAIQAFTINVTLDSVLAGRASSGLEDAPL